MWPWARSAHVWPYRRGHDDLGDHYLDCGDLSNALKCYSRARDYCTSAKHVINMCLNVIKVGPAWGGWAALRAAGQCPPEPGGGAPAEPTPPACQVSVYLQNWSHVLSYVSKAESTPEIAEVTAASPLCPRTAAPRWAGPSPDCPCPSGWGRAQERTRVWRLVADVSHFPLQQRGERDSQTQAILTKLKCAAGEGFGPGDATAEPSAGVACAGLMSVLTARGGVLIAAEETSEPPQGCLPGHGPGRGGQGKASGQGRSCG